MAVFKTSGVALAGRARVILVERWLRHDWNNPETVGLIRTRLEEFSLYLKGEEKKLFIVADVPNFNYPLNDIAARMEIVKPRYMERGRFVTV